MFINVAKKEGILSICHSATAQDYRLTKALPYNFIEKNDYNALINVQSQGVKLNEPDSFPNLPSQV